MESGCVSVCTVLIIEISMPKKSIPTLYGGFLLTISKEKGKKKVKAEEKSQE